MACPGTRFIRSGDGGAGPGAVRSHGRGREGDMTNDSPFAPAYEVGVIVFADTDTGDRVVEGLREVGATHLVNDISILEHHENGRFSVDDYAQGATKGTKVGAGAIIGSVAGAIVLGPFGLLAGLIGGGVVGATLGGRNPHDLGLS